MAIVFAIALGENFLAGDRLIADLDAGAELLAVSATRFRGPAFCLAPSFEALGRAAREIDRLDTRDADVDEAATHFAIFEDRSEEHTSELQSLMRISYAVFCLKK